MAVFALEKRFQSGDHVRGAHRFVMTVLFASTAIGAMQCSYALAQTALRGTVGDTVLQNGQLVRNGQIVTDPKELLRLRTENPDLAALIAVETDPTDQSGADEAEIDPTEVPPWRRGPSSGLAEVRTESEQVDPFGEEPLANGLSADELELLTPEELEELARGQRRARAARAVGPSQSQTDIDGDDNPYEAVGLTIGTFTLRPTIDAGIAYANQTINRQNSGTPPQLVSQTQTGILAEVDAAFELESNWSRHSLLLEGTARAQESLDGDAEARPEFGLRVTGEYEISEQTRLIATGDYNYVLDEPGSGSISDTEASADELAIAPTPSEQTLQASLSLAHDTGSVFGALTAEIERSMFGDVDLEDGATVDRSDQDNTLYSGALRAGFRASPVLRPYVEGEIGLRRNDQSIDANGFARDSMLYALRLGTEVDFGEKLTGELSIGYLSEVFDDDALVDLGGVALDAELAWSPRRGTDVGLTMATVTQPGGSEDVSGTVNYTAGLLLDQQVRRNLAVSLGADIEYAIPEGAASSTTTIGGNLGLTYWFNRYVGMIGRYGYERTLSSDDTQESDDHSAFIGLRFQR